MAQLSDAARHSLTYWGVIQSSVEARASTGDLWAAIRADADANNRTTLGATVAGVNQLRSIAVAGRNAEAALAKAPDTSDIIDRHVAVSVTARDLAVRDAAPMYSVSFTHTYTDEDGNLNESYRTLMIRGQLPPTVGDLRNQVEEAGQALSADYGVTHVGTGNIRISAV